MASSIWAIWSGSMLPADVFARFCRARGHDTLVICATDEHGAPVELAALEEGRPCADYCAERHEVQKRSGRALRPLLGSFRPLVLAAEPRADAAFRARAVEERLSGSAHHQAGLFRRPTAASCPTAMSSAPVRIAATTARAATSARTAPACSIPIDLIDPRSAVSGAHDIEIRDSTHLFLKQSQFVPTAARLDRQPQERLAAARHLHRLQMAGRGAAGPRHHPRPGMGRSGAGRHRATASSRARCSTSGSTRRSNISPRPRNGPTRTARAMPGSDWWFGDAAKDVTYCEFMGKDNVPFHTVGFPGHDHGLGRALEAGGPAQGLQLAQL